MEKSLHQPSELLILDSPKYEDSGHLRNFALRTLKAIMKSGKPHLSFVFKTYLFRHTHHKMLIDQLVGIDSFLPPCLF